MTTGLGIYVIGGTVYWAAAMPGEKEIRVTHTGQFALDNEIPQWPPDMPDDIALGLDAGTSFFFKAGFPFRSSSRIQAVLKNDIEDRCLAPIETLCVTYCPTGTAPEGGIEGYAMTAPREKVEALIRVTGTEHEAALVTLSLFSVIDTLHTCGRRSGTWFIAELGRESATMVQVADGKVQQFRSIPVKIDGGAAAAEAMQELMKRFEIADPARDIVVMAPDPELGKQLRHASGFDYTCLEVPAAMPAGTDALLFQVPACLALSALAPGRFPNFRNEDLAYPGMFHALIDHAILFLAVIAVGCLVLLGLVHRQKAAYIQQITSMEARISQEAELVIGTEELEKALRSSANDMVRAVKKIADSYRVTASAEGDALPDSRFILLCEILSYLPADLDVNWKRINLARRDITLLGDLVDKSQDLQKFDTFVSSIKDSGRYTIAHKQVTNGESISLRLQYNEEEK